MVKAVKTSHTILRQINQAKEGDLHSILRSSSAERRTCCICESLNLSVYQPVTKSKSNSPCVMLRLLKAEVCVCETWSVLFMLATRDSYRLVARRVLSALAQVGQKGSLNFGTLLFSGDGRAKPGPAPAGIMTRTTDSQTSSSFLFIHLHHFMLIDQIR